MFWRFADQHYKVQVKVIVADFKKTDIYENIKQQLNGLDIGILGKIYISGSPEQIGISVMLSVSH